LIRLKKKIQRQERILSSLNKLTYSTSEQINTIEKLGSDRNARKVLFELEEDKLIKSVRRNKKIYFVTNKGNDLIGKGNTRLKRNEIDHSLMRNDLYIKLGMPDSWKKESRIIINKEVFLISDARFVRNGIQHYIEIDNKQTMRTNYDKIKKYAHLFKVIFRKYNHHPVLIWYTLSDVRKRKLSEACRNYGVKYEVF